MRRPIAPFLPPPFPMPFPGMPPPMFPMGMMPMGLKARMGGGIAGPAARRGGAAAPKFVKKDPDAPGKWGHDLYNPVDMGPPRAGVSPANTGVPGAKL